MTPVQAAQYSSEQKEYWEREQQTAVEERTRQQIEEIKASYHADMWSKEQQQI